MSTAIADLHEAPAESRVNYLNASYGIKSWLLTLDHKRIGLLYLGSITLMFFVGGMAAVLMRLHLIEPQGALLEPETYNKLFSTHGIIMVFFFLVPSIPATLGNFLIPLMIGARDVAFPKLNLLSWYIFITGCCFRALRDAVRRRRYRLDVLSAVQQLVFAHARGRRGAGCFHRGIFFDPHGLEFHRHDPQDARPGHDLVPAAALHLGDVRHEPDLRPWHARDRHHAFLAGGWRRILHVGIFDPALGGDPLLFQHLFWFYSHPAVYIMILPGMGVISELITAFSRKKIFGYSFVAFSSLAIAIISFVVWGHHMFVTGQSIYAGLVFSVLSFLVAIPSAVKVFNWTATLYKGSISYEAPMLYALGFIGLFTMGGLTGLFLASLATDVHLNGTYFIVAHFHYVMVGGAVMAYMGGLHYWWPKITGRLYPDVWARIAAAYFHRLQSHVLPAIHARLFGNAAAVRRLSRGVPGAERDVLGGRFDPGDRLCDSADLFRLVHALRPACWAESVGRQGPRVDHSFAAAH